MSNFRIFETSECLSKLSALPKVDGNFLEKKLKEYVYPQLRQEPHFGQNIKRLVDYVPSTWRYRIGKFLVFYSISISEAEKVVFILTVELRRDAFK